ncbi:MAG TPA: hypothetical protein VF695_06445, partial [Sphingomonas sp.]
HAARLAHRPLPVVEANGSPSLWVALSRDPAALAQLSRRDPDWTAMTAEPGFRPWTDDYSTILPLLKSF